MTELSLVCVREDARLGDELAQALERYGFSICRSATVFENFQGYAGVIVLLSPASSRSALVAETAERAHDWGKLIPCFVGLCSVPDRLSGVGMHDLSTWSGAPEDVVIAAISAHANRLSASPALTQPRGNGRRGASAATPALDDGGYARRPMLPPAGPPSAQAASPTRAEVRYPAPTEQPQRRARIAEPAAPIETYAPVAVAGYGAPMDARYAYDHGGWDAQAPAYDAHHGHDPYYGHAPAAATAAQSSFLTAIDEGGAPVQAHHHNQPQAYVGVDNSGYAPIANDPAPYPASYRRRTLTGL